MIPSKKISLSLIAVVLLGCSTQKDTFINRTFHSVTTKYNVLHNGNEAFENGLTELSSNYTDDFWERLPIEPLKVDELALPGMSRDVDASPAEFEKAEEKAVKAIQKHSMVINHRERNNQIDDAYLLLGKARYFSKRFVPALEAFNVVLLNYPDANLFNETKIWHAKTLVRLQNEDQAIENLKFLLKDKDLSKETKETAHTALAMAYEKADSIPQVISQLIKATKTSFNTEQTARNLFILGQIYREQNKIDSSSMAFSKLIELKKAPHKYVINAEVEKAKNVTNKVKAIETKEYLLKLLKNRDNKTYSSPIYFQLGNLEKLTNSDGAIVYFKKSIAENKEINKQKEFSYQALGDIYFDKSEFVTAGKYYDSILRISKEENTKRIRSLTRKRNNLNEVIKYETLATVNDSILKIAALSPEEQKEYFTQYVQKLKDQEAKSEVVINTGSAIEIQNSGSQNAAGKWYFYNIQAVGYGETEFKRVWGNRPLEENWRLSDKNVLALKTSNKPDPIAIESNPSKIKDVEFYLNQIPKNKIEIDSLVFERNEAYFKLGVIYKEQFKLLNKASEKLEQLLTFNPVEEIKLPAKYHLFKIYEETNNPKKEDLKNDIITNYKNSQFAKILVNPSEIIMEDEIDIIEKEYQLAYYEYKDENYEVALQNVNQAIEKYNNIPILPKYELLKAFMVGKTKGTIAFKEALDFVAMKYPNTEEGKKALELSEALKTKL